MVEEVKRFAAIHKCISIAEQNTEACEDWGGLIEEANEQLSNMNRVLDAAFKVIHEDADPLDLDDLRKVMESIGWRVR